MSAKPKIRINKRQAARLTLKDILNWTTLSNDKAFQLAQVHRTTWERWITGESNPPPATIELLRLHAYGLVMPESFTDCMFGHDGLLYDDHGYGHSLGDLRVFNLYRKNHYRYMTVLRDYELIPKPKQEGQKADEVPAMPFKKLRVA